MVDMAPDHQYHSIFGDDKHWPDTSDWSASDDRVRGGSSQSFVECTAREARFHGNLDIDTLGGAGFASQYLAPSEPLDLSRQDGIAYDVTESDGKEYTLILKDEVLPRNPENGRERATISWEHDFRVSPEIPSGLRGFAAWSDFKPTYRGKEVKDAKPLRTKSIIRVGLMQRSFFGQQKGPFSITLLSLGCFKEVKADPKRCEAAGFPYPYRDFPADDTTDCVIDEKACVKDSDSDEGICSAITSCMTCTRSKH